jgi:branched-chain amino acid transport system substrate-binding protein
MQVIEEAIDATHTLDADKLAGYLREHVHPTIVGDLKFGADGEWSKSGVLFVQYQGISGNDLEQFRKPGTYVVLAPDEFRSNAKLIYPYTKTRE